MAALGGEQLGLQGVSGCMCGMHVWVCVVHPCTRAHVWYTRVWGTYGCTCVCGCGMHMVHTRVGCICGHACGAHACVGEEGRWEAGVRCASPQPQLSAVGDVGRARC